MVDTPNEIKWPVQYRVDPTSDGAILLFKLDDGSVLQIGMHAPEMSRLASMFQSIVEDMRGSSNWKAR